MIRYCFTIFASLIFCSSVSLSQVKKPVRDSKPSASPRVKQQQLREQEKYAREQAVLSLRSVLLNAKAIEKINRKADVITDAADVLWEHDKSLAEEALLAFINQSLAEYKELLNSNDKLTKEESSRLQDLSYAIKKSISGLAKKDLIKSESLQNSFFEIREQSLKGRELNDKFELAAEGLEFDEQRTVDFLLTIIQQGIPNRLPKFVSELREKKPAVANLVVQRAVQNLAVNFNYTVSDAILTSAMVFNEAGIIIPTLSDDANPNKFYVFSSFIGNQKSPVGKQHLSAYLTSVQNFFNGRLNNPALGFFDSRQNLLKSYFLIEKLRAYNQVYKLQNPETLNAMSRAIEALMQATEFSQQTFSDIRGYAQRLAAVDNPLGLDDGTNLLEKAENAKDEREKMGYLIKATIQFIQFKKFAEAQTEIFKIESVEIREPMLKLLNQRIALEAIKNKDWNEFEKRVGEITDKDARAFLYLKALSTFEPEKENNLLADYLNKAQLNIGFISDETVKASAYMNLASLLLSLNQTEGSQVFPSALSAVNQAPDYYQNDFKMTTKIPVVELEFVESLGADSFKTSFSKIAQLQSWNDAQAQVVQLKSESLKAVAHIVIAQSALRKRSRLASISQ